MRIRIDHALPPEYQEVEYIENTDTKYLDTGIVAANKLFQLDIQFTSNATRQLMGIAGSSSEYFGNNKGTWEKIGNSQNVSTLSRCIINYDVGNLTANKTTTWIEGSSTREVGGSTDFASNSALNLRIFKLGNSSYNCKMKLFKIKAYNASNNLVNHLIPCYRRSDNKTGVYDVINNTFIATSANMSVGPNRNVILKIKERRLPAIYQEVEYIAAAGGPYIQTDYVPSYANGFEIFFKFSPQDKTSRYCLGANYNEGPAQLSCELQNGQQRYWANTGGLNTYIGTITTNINYAIYKYESGQWFANCNGTTNSGAYAVTGIPTTTMRLFLDRANRTSTFNHTLKLYSCVISSKGQVLKRFIPCYRKSDNIIGLYEEISGTFLTNAGSGSFTKGNDINYQRWQPATIYDLLPDIYQPIKYIQSSGTQYINTDYYWTTLITKLEADIEVLSNSSNQSLWGNEEYYSGSNRYFAGIPHGANGTYAYYIGNGGKTGFKLTLNTRTQIEVSTNGTTYSIKKDGTDVVVNNNTSTTFLTHDNASTITNNSGKIYIFANHNSGANGATSTGTQMVGAMRLYSFKMYDNNNMVRWFIPCYHKLNETIGLFDIINNQFYQNAGTGIFIKGGNI